MDKPSRTELRRKMEIEISTEQEQIKSLKRLCVAVIRKKFFKSTIKKSVVVKLFANKLL